MTPNDTETCLLSVRVRADGCTAHVAVYENGLTIGPRPGRGRLVTWTEVSRLADGPPADRYGVVINGRLMMVFEEESEAEDRAADQRQLGMTVTVIRVPVSVTA